MIEISVVDENALFEYAMSQAAIIAGPPQYQWHEKNVEDAQKADATGNADIEVCVPIAARIPENDEIKCYILPGGKNSKIVHKSPYEASGPVY